MTGASPRDPARSLVERQRRAAELLRRELTDADGSGDHPYFRDLRRQLAGEARSIGVDEWIADCARADLLYVADYHALPTCQRLAATVLREVARRVPRLALGVEFVYTRQQHILARRQEGLLDDEGFLRRIHYREEWGYPWEGYRDLLDAAREAGVPVFALDSPPRGGFDGLGRRDHHAARRIVSILGRADDMRLLVLFGEAHVTRSHLPRRVKTRLKRVGLERRELTVLQNPDELYWRLVAAGERTDLPVRIDGSTYAVFHTGPLEKYETYRQVLELWGRDDPAGEEVDFTPAVHHLIGVLLEWLGIRAHRYRLHHRAGWAEELEDAYPEVYGGSEAEELLAPILAEHGRTEVEIDEARSLLAGRGALYEPRSNALFLRRYLPGQVAGEAARFLRAALTRRLFIAADDFGGDPVGRTYGAAYNEGLAFLASRLVDPAADTANWRERWAQGGGVLPARRPSARSPERVAAAAGWLRAHRRLEAGRARVLPRDLVEPLGRSRRLRREVARDLGRRLGRKLFEAVRRGDLDQRRLRRLFARPLPAKGAARVVLELLRG